MELSRIISLLGYSIAILGFIPLFPHIPIAPRLVFTAGLVIGLLSGYFKKQLVHHLVLTVISTLLFIWYGAQFSRHNPAVPVVCILVVLLGTRLAAEKSPRTWLQTSALSTFALSASSLFDLGPRFLLYLALMLPMIALSLVLNTFQSRGGQAPLDKKGLKNLIAAGIIIPVASLILTPVFFPVLPRTQFPLWNFIQQAGGTHPSGLSDTVKPGATSQIPENGILAFRADMSRTAPQNLYWRGPTFSRLNGLVWQKDGYGVPNNEKVEGPQIVQTITLEPGGNRFLTGLDAPLSFVHQNGSAIPNAIWNRPLPSSRRFRYEVRSATSGNLKTETTPGNLLSLIPTELSEKTRELALKLKKTGKNDRERLDAIEQFFRNGKFRYSRNDLPTGEDAIEKFLFETRSGHCEFFASSFAFLARGAGLPARLVGGYFGGEYNELGGYYRISDDRAHVWVEVWIDGEGWLRRDPSSLAVNADAALGESKQKTLGMKLRLLVDSMDHRWNSAIITYDFERQLQVATNTYTQLTSVDTGKIKRMAVPLIFITAAAAILFFWLRLYRKNFFRPENRLLARFRLEVEKKFGVSRDEKAGLFDIAERTGDPNIREFVDIYASAIYHDRRLTDEEIAKLRKLLN